MVLQGPYPFLVFALTLNLYSVLSSRSENTVLRSVVDRIRFSSGIKSFQNWMSYIVTWNDISLKSFPKYIFWDSTQIL